MINAPSAAEKPTFTANKTMIKHNANETISIVSSFISFLVALRKEGIRKIPPINQRTRKKASFRIEVNISAPANC
ncbi:hypothetical protein D3C73_1583690 [compost metagenome]